PMVASMRTPESLVSDLIVPSRSIVAHAGICIPYPPRHLTADHLGRPPVPSWSVEMGCGRARACARPGRADSRLSEHLRRQLSTIRGSGGRRVLERFPARRLRDRPPGTNPITSLIGVWILVGADPAS